jgi:hypothetical protein
MPPADGLVEVLGLPGPIPGGPGRSNREDKAMKTKTAKRPTDRKQDKSKTAPTEFWFDVEAEHRRLYAIRPNEAGKLLFYLDRNEVLEISFRRPCNDETGWPQHTPDLAPADVQTIAKSKTLKGIFYVFTVAGGSFRAYMLRRGYTATERRTVPNDCEEREPTRADTAGKAELSKVRRELASVKGDVSKIKAIDPGMKQAGLDLIRRTKSLNDNEKNAALLWMEKSSLADIGVRLRGRNGQGVSKQRAQQILDNAACKMGDPRMFRHSTYRNEVAANTDDPEQYRPTTHY